MSIRRDSNGNGTSNGNCNGQTQSRKDAESQGCSARHSRSPVANEFFVVETVLQSQSHQLPAVLDAAQSVAHGLQPVAFTCSIAQPSADG